MAKSQQPLAEKYPTAPAYGPRAAGSMPSIISMALTFGAPETVPAGNTAANASNMSAPARRRPATCETMCCTWLNRLIRMSSSTRTEPYSHTRPMSLRPRSTSIVCSASSFSSASSSRASRSSAAESPVTGRVPAIGNVSTSLPVTRTSISGEAPTATRPPCRTWNM